MCAPVDSLWQISQLTQRCLMDISWYMYLASAYGGGVSVKL